MDDSLNLSESGANPAQHFTISYTKTLDFTQSCEFLGVSVSRLAELSYTGDIPCYMPTKNRLIYRRKDLDAWLLRNKYIPFQEINLPDLNCRHLGKDTV